MQVTSINSSVLGGQGSIGSGAFAVPVSTPGIGPMGGDAVAYDVAVPIANPGNDNFDGEAAEPLPSHLAAGIPPAATPAPSAAFTDGGPSNEPVSQYSTQGPIPKG